jgi:hypothetical protein
MIVKDNETGIYHYVDMESWEDDVDTVRCGLLIGKHWSYYYMIEPQDVVDNFCENCGKIPEFYTVTMELNNE